VNRLFSSIVQRAWDFWLSTWTDTMPRLSVQTTFPA
jgi:hypothetical protein